MKTLGNVLVLGYPKDWIRVPLVHAVASPPPSLHDRTFKTLCLEVVVAMNRRWGYNTADHTLCDSLAPSCNAEVMAAIGMNGFFGGKLLE